MKSRTPRGETRRRARPAAKGETTRARGATGRDVARPAWLDPRLALPAALALTVLVHHPALDTWFAQDDVTFLARAQGISPIPWSLARPLYEGVTFRVLHALFGLDPRPYHAVNLLIHLLNTMLVALIARRIVGGAWAAGAAALLFGVSGIAFTPLHWAAGVLELQVTALALVAFLLFLEARERRSTLLLWLGALAGLAAALTKENAVLLPVVLAATRWRGGGAARRWKAVAPQTLLSAAFAVAFALTIRQVHFAGSEAYARSFAPAFLLANLSTYLRWCVSPHVPVRDAVAAADFSAIATGLVLIAALALVLWWARREEPHPEEVGAVWFAAMLAPVLPLEHRTYLYYLYLPWAGACWLLAGLGARLSRRWPSFSPAALAVLLLLVVGLEFFGARARERLAIGNFPVDKVVRESRLLRRSLEQLRGMKLPRGTRVAFVNPTPRRHFNLAGGDTALTDTATTDFSYLPLEGALRGGEALRVFLPGVTYLGFGETVPRAWEDARLMLFNDQARLEDLGSGSPAMAEFATMCLTLHQWERADTLLRRTRERGDTLPDATFGLIITSDFLGRREESDRYAHEFIRRWPRDARAAVIDSALKANAARAGAPSR